MSTVLYPLFLPISRHLRLAAAACLLWFVAIGVASALDPIPMYGASLIDFKLVDAAGVEMKWPDLQEGYGEAPTLEDGQKFAIATVRLEKSGSVYVTDYKIGDEPCLALRFKDQPFNPKLKKVDPSMAFTLDMLFRVDDVPEFMMVLNYDIPTLKDTFRIIKIDIRPPVDPNAPKVLEVPADFDFPWLMGQSAPVELTPHLTDTLKAVSVGSDLYQLQGPLDTITSKDGIGLKAVMNGEILTWTPETFACYRNNALIGIYDYSTKVFRAAQAGEAPATLNVEASAPVDGAAPAGAVDPAAGAAAAVPNDVAAPVAPGTTPAATPAPAATTAPPAPPATGTKPKDPAPKAANEWGGGF